MKKHRSLSHVSRILIVFFAVFISLFVTFKQNIQHKIQKNAIESHTTDEEGKEQPPLGQYSFVSSMAVAPVFGLGVAVATLIFFFFSSPIDNCVKP